MAPEVAVRLRLAGAAALTAVLVLVLTVSDATAHRAQVYTSHAQVAATAVLAGVAGARGRTLSTDGTGLGAVAPSLGDSAGGGPLAQFAAPSGADPLAQATRRSTTRYTRTVGSAAAPTAGEPRAPPPATQA